MAFTNGFYNKNKATGRYEFDIENVDVAIVNSIRRVILADIPVLGFLGEGHTSIEIIKNTGPLHNEIMYHRIGVIPLHFTEEELEEFVENEYVFNCSVKNTDVAMLNVTTKDITGTRNLKPLTQKELVRIFPPNPITKDFILITRLRQGEELTFKATVVKLTAKDHASFSPVSMCAFFYKNDHSNHTEILDKERDYLKNEYGDPTDIHFMMETETSLTPNYIVTKAIEILIQKVIDIPKNSTIVKNDKIENTYDINIANEDDTLGNLFQSIIYTEFIRNNKREPKMNYVGYYAPHPLEKKIVIRISLDKKCEHEGFEVIVKDCCKIVEHQLREVKNSWMRFL
jgi:DNA-directed RNA polymerase subunit L